MSTTERQATLAWLLTFGRISTFALDQLIDGFDAPSETLTQTQTMRLVARPAVMCQWCCNPFDGPHTARELMSLAESDAAERCLGCEGQAGRDWLQRQLEPHALWSGLFCPTEADSQWIRAQAHEVAALGFYVFENSQQDCLLGAPSQTPDLLDRLWIPLYRLRELKSHGTC